MSGKDKLKDQKKITTIQQWVVCFSSFMSVMEIRHPKRVRELIAYLAMITKASQDYEGLPWLAYDSHFRRVAAASGSWEWSQVNLSLWTPNGDAASLPVITTTSAWNATPPIIVVRSAA